LFHARRPIRCGLSTIAYHPGWVLAGYLAWSAAVMMTPVALWSVSNHAVLMVTRLGDIAVGTALFGTVLFASALPTAKPVADDGRRTAGAYRWLILWFTGEAVLTGLLMSGGAAAARPWFTQLNIAWITTSQDEQTAAMLRLAVVLLVFVVACAAGPARTRHLRRLSGQVG
jgi:hypothetical protein